MPSSEPPFMNETPSMISPVVGFSHSGPAKPRTPESGPNSRSKIAPSSSKTMALRPSGAAGWRNGRKFVSSTSTASAPALTCVAAADGIASHAANAAVVCAIAWALFSGPRPP